MRCKLCVSILLSLLLFTLIHTDQALRANCIVTCHPRLFMNEDEKQAVSVFISRNDWIKNVHSYIIDVSNGYLTSPLLKRDLIGLRMLSVSREALRRIFFLSYSYRFTGEKAYADRAISEMVEVCGFEDWNPSHFLDVAEMAIGVSIGYDWLYDVMNDELRHYVAHTVIEKALKVSLNHKYSRFVNETNNWNQVCNASMLYAAIVFMEEDRYTSRLVIDRCLQSNPKAMSAYAPDGGYPEGYNYWGFGTIFQVLLIDALERIYGNDYGMLSYPGFIESGFFIQMMNTPIGECFNFGDSPIISKGSIASFWLAYKRQDASMAYLEYKRLCDSNLSFSESEFLPLIPIWATRLNCDSIAMPKRNFWFNRGKTPVFVYRSGWDSEYDSYLGVKGGSPSESHAHMDAGSFVYEYNGIRWATDLGMQDYNSLERKGVKMWDSRQNGERWNIMRMRNDCHNTLTIDNAQHIVKAKSEIIHTFQSFDHKGAVVDLTPMFKCVEKVHRDKDNLVIIDTIMTANRHIEVKWVMVTSTEADIVNDNVILLRKNNYSMQLTADSNTSIESHIWSNEPMHSYDALNPGTVRVGFTFLAPANKETIIKIVLQPQH